MAKKSSSRQAVAKNQAAEPVAEAPVAREKPSNPLRDAVSHVYLLLAWLWFMRVWFWHTEPPAHVLPGAKGWGWFFRYLTFYGFTVQTVQLNASLAAAFTVNRKNLESGQGKWLRDLAATLSAATFPFANLVTVLFHLVRISQGMDGTVEGGEIERPPWLGFTVHNLNCIVAWWHLLLAPHDFSTTAEKLSALLLVGYLSVILVAYYVNGSFPYPFLNRLPLPWGFMAMVLAALLIFVSIFRLGKLVKKAVPFTRPVTEPTKVD